MGKIKDKLLVATIRTHCPDPVDIPVSLFPRESLLLLYNYGPGVRQHPSSWDVSLFLWRQDL